MHIHKFMLDGIIKILIHIQYEDVDKDTCCSNVEEWPSSDAFSSGSFLKLPYVVTDNK